MRTNLRWLALVVALAVVAVWTARGAHTGWTRNSVQHVEKDPVTELEVKRDEPKWVPGVDFLVPGLALAGGLAGASFFCRRRKPA